MGFSFPIHYGSDFKLFPQFSVAYTSNIDCNKKIKN